MAIADTQTFPNVDAAKWQRIKDLILQKVGITVSSDHGTDAAKGIQLTWIYNADNSSLIVTLDKRSLLLIYSIIQRVHDAVTQTTVKAQAAARTVKLSQIRQYLDKQQIETATGVPFNVAYNYEVALGF